MTKRYVRFSIQEGGGGGGGVPADHASSHEAGGTDALALDAAQIATGVIDEDRLPPGGGGGELSGLVDPAADRIVFWDDSANGYQYLTPGTNLTIAGTTLNAADLGPGAPAPHAASHEGGGDDELALDANQITTGTFDDARIPTGVARDSEVTAAISAVTKTSLGLGNVVNVDQSNADNLTSGQVADARIPSTIARDSEITTAIGALSSTYQPLDTDLTAIAALTSAANKFPYATGAGTWAMADVVDMTAVAAASGVLDSSDTVLALEDGTLVQATAPQITAGALDSGTLSTGGGSVKTVHSATDTAQLEFRTTAGDTREVIAIGMFSGVPIIGFGAGGSSAPDASISRTVANTLGLNATTVACSAAVTAASAAVSGAVTAASVTTTTAIKSTGATSAGGIGYATGAGGTVTQGAGTNKNATVTLNKLCGEITTTAEIINTATWTTFICNNNTVAASDVVAINHISGGTIGAYWVNARALGGSIYITIKNDTTGNLSEALILRFAVIKAVTS